MDELRRLKGKFFEKEIAPIIIGKIDQEYLKKIINNMKKDEEPDIISAFDDKVIGIEHFEFDSYKNNKKGSELIAYEARLYNGEVIDHKIVGDMMTRRNINQYYKNFIKHFEKHYNKIENYTSKLEEKYPNKKHEIYFFVEDTSLYGNLYIENGKVSQLLPVYSIEILDMLENRKDVKYIFFFINKVSDKNNHYCDEKLIIFQNDKTNREELKEELKNKSMRYCKCITDIDENGDVTVWV